MAGYFDGMPVFVQVYDVADGVTYAINVVHIGRLWPEHKNKSTQTDLMAGLETINGVRYYITDAEYERLLKLLPMLH